jgi:hypothetical protein
MIRWRGRRSGEVRREHMLVNALQTSPADITRITLKVRGVTVVLGGSLAQPPDRNGIIECVLRDMAVGQVIDLMALPGEQPPAVIHMRKERPRLSNIGHR